MIAGIGTDLTEVERIARALREYGERFEKRVFADSEIAYCRSTPRRSAERYAARFAAKEAFFKALGTGWLNGTAFNEVEITHDEKGKPALAFLGETATVVAAMHFTNISVSLTHLKTIASAVVIIEQ